ncbi:glutamine synthetase/guanido kinase [Lactarius akahatsu]|uniref:Glutamine synthetase n=1 Tax=Lactarius akahatsu TaxID=416441 RepID=A0AAD4LMC7_9AGAM|nr:glutamine synthetase/guanido kinase [Lactarius akahatsu]
MAPTSTSEVAFGLRHLPVSAKLPTLGRGDVVRVIRSLDELGIRYIRFQWVDYTNISRSRIIPLPAFSELLGASRPGLGIGRASFGIAGSSLAPGFSPTGECLHTPDLSSIRLCGYAPGHASLMGWFEEKLPIQKQVGGDALEMSLCPRGLLKGIVNKGHALGVEFLVGFETEFVLLKTTQPIRAVNDATWSASCAFSPGSDAAECLEEIADALRTGEIELVMYHSKAAPGQYEVVTGPLPPLEATDAVAFTRETIVNIAAKHGLRATFAPRVYADSTGTAAHSHISIRPTAQPPANPPPVNPNTNKDTTMTLLERSFLQSLLENLPSSTVFTMPTATSYDRVQDGIWSCGTYACWGEDNNDVAIRLTGPPGSHHLEVRTIDGTANPHIAIATVLGLGLIGVQKGLELKIGATDRPAVLLSAEERTKKGIVGHLHRTLSAARDATRKDATISDVLGQEFVQAYLSVNEVRDH